MKTKTYILDQENVGRLLFKFSLPCMASLLISSLYNMVDQIFVGNSSLGYLGNAATGVVFPLVLLTQGFAWWFGDGCCSYLSICQGRKQPEKASKAIGLGILLTLLSGLLIVLFGLLFDDEILLFCGASEKTIPLAKEYLHILIGFFPVYMLQNMLNGVIRGDGSPSYSMIATLSGAILNIILDPIFIYACDFGIAGAAWATVIGQVVSFFFCAIYFLHPKSFRLDRKSFIPDFSNFREPFLLGISSFITQISVAVVSLVLNSMLVRYGNLSKYGQDIPISVTSIETKVYTIVLNIVVGIVLGGQPIIGYNIGAGKIDRVKKTYRLILISTLIISAIFTFLFEVFPDLFVMMFGGKDDELYMEYGRLVFRLFLSTTILTCFIKFSSIFFQSCGYPVQATIASLSRDLLFYIPLVILIPYVTEQKQEGSGIVSLLFAPMIADTLSFLLTIFFTFQIFHKLNEKRLDQEKNIIV